MKDYYNGGECLYLINKTLKNLKVSDLDAFMAGNVIKYLYRYPNKDKAKDLKKALNYIDCLFGIEADIFGRKICKDLLYVDLGFLKDCVESCKISSFQKLIILQFINCLLISGNSLYLNTSLETLKTNILSASEYIENN